MFSNELNAITALLKTFPAVGSQEILEEVKRRAETLRRERLRFLEEEYAPQVRTIMSAWCSSVFSGSRRREAFLSALRISTQGRIVSGRTADTEILNLSELSGDFFHFPRLIERAAGNLQFVEIFLEEIDQLVYVDGALYMSSSNIGSMNRLQKIGGRLSVTNSPMTHFPAIEEIAQDIILAKTEIENFRDYFPRLRKVGVDSRGASVSFFLNPQNAHLKEQLEELRREGSLDFEGSIVIGTE